MDIPIDDIVSQGVVLDRSFSTKFEASELPDRNSIKSLIKRRSGKRQSLTKTISSYKNAMPLSLAEVNFYIVKLENLQDSLSKFDLEIESFMLDNNLWDDSEFTEHSDNSEAYFDKISRALIELKALTDPVGVVDNGNMSINSASGPNIKLPTLDLPSFDGTPERLESFISSFEGIIGRCNVSSFQKFNYLKQCLSGPAKELVSSIPSTNLNYDDAKQLLIDAFSSTLKQQFSVIDKLLNIKLDDINDFYGWISNVRVLTDSAERLDINRSIFLQYFVWRNISNTIKKEFISVTNVSQPSLENILDRSFEVRNRLCHTSGDLLDKPKVNTDTVKKSYNKQSVSNDVNAINSSDRRPNNNCRLCSADNSSDCNTHTIYNCPRYDTPNKKLDRIKKSKGCTRCGFLDHTIDNCHFKFKGRCRTCKKFHAYFLCINKSYGESNHNSKQNKTLSSANSVSVRVMNVESGRSDEIIPSFTMTLNRINGTSTIDNRVMYDPASQVSFISESAVERIKHKIIVSNCELCINGFNDSKNLISKVVEVTTNLNNEPRTFRAFVVPSIKTQIKSSYFTKVNKVFKQNKIKLADTHLGDNGVVDILLGVDYANILPVHSISFGDTNRLSHIYYCAAGIMISGNMSCLLTNARYLDIVRNFMSKVDSMNMSD